MEVGVLGFALALAVAAAAWFGARLLMLRRSIRKADAELREIVERLEDNRIVKLGAPDRDFEAFLCTVNRALEGVRRQAVLYDRREADLKAQVESISHDLRTPLTSILGYLTLVDEEGLDAETRESLRIVRRKADALQRLIAQFYELSQVRGGAMRLEREQVDVGRMLRESVAEQYRLLEERGLDARLAAPEHAVYACVDGNAFERVLSNLLHNAGKYAKTAIEFAVDAAPEKPEGSGAGRVVVRFANDADRLAPHEVERLFEPFYVADASRSQESSGLGLAVARMLVEQMGGALTARQEERDGVPWISFEAELESTAGR